jgi:serine phosphatase RsbU (regulator of sigma subunit)
VLVLAGPAGAAERLDLVARCIELGAEDYLAEPFEPPFFGARVGACLERRRLRDADRRLGGARELTRELTRELEIGREIQAGFLPAALPSWPGWEVAAAFEAARQVSGDFYDAFALAGGLHLGVVVGDVCGKGVGASLFMALFRSLIRAVATQVVHSGLTMPGNADERLSTALRVANTYIAEVHGGANMFATAFAAAVNPLSGHVRWANAGHEPALVIAAGGGVRARLEPTGPALGLLPDMPLTLGAARLAPGETLLVTTDGVSESRDRAGAFFGTERLEALCAEPAGGAAALAGRVTAAVHAFTAGAEPADDLTLVVVHRAAPQAPPRP